jgi:hypothetical protein
MKLFKHILLIFFIMPYICNSQSPFTAGNIVVYRIGDGNSVLGSNAEKVFLDEYTPLGVLVQSIPMPTIGNKITMSGGLTDAGYLSLSANGKYLVVPGWDLDLGTPLITVTGNNRSIGLVDFNGLVTHVNVITNNPATVPINAAASNDGNGIWFVGGTAVEYIINGTTTSTSISTLSSSAFSIGIAQDQLYASTNNTSLPLVQIGSGLPTTGSQTFANLPGIPARTRPRQFAFADLDPNVPGADVIYLASQNPLVPGGIQKYSLVNGTWVSNGQIGTTAEAYSGLTIAVNGSVVTIFATRQGSNSATIRGGELVKLTDNSGYNATISGTVSVIAAVTTADTKAFRGVALVPRPAPFTPGNIAVYRVGDGSAVLSSNTAKVFIDEYTTSGTLIQSLLMPLTGNKITMPGALADAGYLSLSANGKYLVVPGWDVNEGISLTSVVGNNRSVGLVDFNRTINNVNVITNNPATVPINSAVSDDGTSIWLAGGTSVEYLVNGSGTSSSVSTLPSSDFSISISEGQLYASTNNNSSPLVQVGTGLPTTSGQSFTNVAGIPARTRPRQFAFADLDPNVPGADVIYLASQNPLAPGGIQKYSFVNGTWVSNGQIGTTAEGYSGLTIKVSGNDVMIFATRQGNNNATIKGGELVVLTDNSGYNGAINGTPVVIAAVTTPNTQAFRGVAKVPSGCPPVVALRVPDISSTAAKIIWDAPAAGTGNYEYAVTTSSTPPANGTLVAQQSANITGLTNGITYYVHVRASCSATSFSEWSTTSFVTGCQTPGGATVNVNISATGVTSIKWKNVFGSTGYEYFISTSSLPPTSGISTSDTIITLSNLNPVTQYFIHLRSDCGSGAFSQWITKAFFTECFMPVVKIVQDAKSVRATWTKITNAVRYEYALTNSWSDPLSGVFSVDTFHTMNELSEGSSQFFHVRTICSNGSASVWATIPFTTIGLQVYPNPVKDLLQVQLNGVANASSEISIGDAMGRVITRLRLNNNTATVNTRGWAPGIYLVRYDDGKNKYSVRIVKQ